MARFIDPRVDWAFKRIFGSEDTKECLITFLNGLFEDELVIKDVTFAKTEKLGLRPDDRGVVFDVYCITNEGKHVIVEMQKKSCTRQIESKLSLRSFAFSLQIKTNNLLYETRN